MLDDVNPDGIWFSANALDISAFMKADKYTDGISINAGGITYDFVLKYGDNEFRSLRIIIEGNNAMISMYSGGAYALDGAMPSYFKSLEIMDGALWDASDNFRQCGLYNIFIDSDVASALGVEVGGVIELFGSDDIFIETLKVKGIYKSENIGNRFIVPVGLCFDNIDKAWISNLNLYLEKTSDAIDIYYKLTKEGIYPENDSFFENIRLVKSTEIILIIIAAVIFLSTFAILSNVLSIVVNQRKEFIAKLRLFGAELNVIAPLYYAVFVALFLLSFLLAVALNFLMKEHYEGVAGALFYHDFSIKVSVYNILAPFLFGIALLAAKYLLFRRKIAEVKPLDYMRTD